MNWRLLSAPLILDGYNQVILTLTRFVESSKAGRSKGEVRRSTKMI